LKARREEWTFDQEPYWLAVTAGPARTTHLLLPGDTDPRHRGSPVG
jgi:hypothetical protein